MNRRFLTVLLALMLAIPFASKAQSKEESMAPVAVYVPSEEMALLQMGLSLYQYQNQQAVQERREARAFEIARISAMNSFNFSDGAVIRDYVNSQVNPYW